MISVLVEILVSISLDVYFSFILYIFELYSFLSIISPLDFFNPIDVIFS